MKIYATFQIYVIIFGSAWFGVDDPWATITFCRRLAEGDHTVTPSVMCMGWLCWWHNHMAHVISSLTALAFLTNMSEKDKSASLSAIQVKNRWNIINIEEKLD